MTLDELTQHFKDVALQNKKQGSVEHEVVKALEELRDLRADMRMAEDALKLLAAWDMLNPPDPEKFADARWCKTLVDAALAAVKRGTKASSWIPKPSL